MTKFRIKLGLTDVREMSGDTWTFNLSGYNVDSIINIWREDRFSIAHDYIKYLFNNKSKRLDILKSLLPTDLQGRIVIEFYSTIEERDHKIKEILN